MTKKPLSPIAGMALILLTASLLSLPARAQFSAGINVAANTPMRSTSDSVPGIRGGGSFELRLNYNFGPRMSTNLTTSRRMINTRGGLESLAHQYGYTQQKGFSIHSKSAGMTVLAIGVGVNLLSTGTSDCGMPKPSLILGIKGGALFSDSKIDEKVTNESGATVLAIRQTGKTSSPFYQVGLDLQYPVCNNISIVTGAAWCRAASKMDLERTSNGSSSLSHFTYSDLQLSVGVQIAFKKNNKRNQPQARTEGQPIGGIVVKGGQNPGSGPRPKGNAMVEGSPIGGITVKGGQNPGSGTRPKGNARVAGNPIGGIIVKGGKNPGGGDTGTKAMVVYTEPFSIKHPALLNYLGTDELVIEKGEYDLDYGANAESRVIVHLHSDGIVHRDLAARSFVFDGTDADGLPITYSIEPQYVNGVAKDILVTYKGHSEKGMK